MFDNGFAMHTHKCYCDDKSFRNLSFKSPFTRKLAYSDNLSETSGFKVVKHEPNGKINKNVQRSKVFPFPSPILPLINKTINNLVRVGGEKEVLMIFINVAPLINTHLNDYKLWYNCVQT